MKVRALSLLCLLGCLSAYAQDPLRPTWREEVWLSAAVRGNAPGFLKDALGDKYKRLRLGAEVGYRSADNFFAGRQVYLDLGARYRMNKWLAFGTEYRYAFRPDRIDRQRLGLQAYLDRSFGRWETDFRFTYQRNFLEAGGRSTQLRNRFGVLYNFRKWKLDPSLSVEFFTEVGPAGGFWEGTRYILGTNISLGKGHSLSPGLVIDRDQNVAWPVNRMIFSLSYTRDLRKG